MLFFVFIMHRLIRCVKQSYLHGINPAILTLPVSGKEVTLFPADANKKEAGGTPLQASWGSLSSRRSRRKTSAICGSN